MDKAKYIDFISIDGKVSGEFSSEEAEHLQGEVDYLDYFTSAIAQVLGTPENEYRIIHSENNQQVACKMNPDSKLVNGLICAGDHKPAALLQKFGG